MRQRILKWIGAMAIAGALPACAQVQLINQVQEIPNVDRSTLSDGEVLIWQEGGTNKWVGAAPGGATGLTNPLTDHLDTTATYGITNDTSGVGLSLGASAMALYGNLTIGQGTDFLISRTDDDEAVVLYSGSGLYKGAGFSIFGEDDATLPGDVRFLYGGGTVASGAQSSSSFVVSRISATDTTTEMMELDWSGNLLLPNGDLAIGTAVINSAKLSVDGDADQVQFAIQGHSTQTANVLEIENSGGTVVFSVDVSGNMTIGGDLTAGELIITEAAAAPTVAAGEGAFWVKNDTPSSPYFTDDATTDFELAVVGGALGAATATSPAGGDDDTSVPTTEWVQDELQRKIYIPAGAMIPNTTAGAASGTTELATNDIMFDSMDFDASTDEFVGFWGLLPDNWPAGGSFAFEFHWTAASGSGDVYWTAGAIVFDDSDAMDAAVTLATAASDTLLTANDMHIGSTISAQTIAGTDNPGDPFYVKISRDADNASDTLAVDAKLIGVTITW